MWYFSPELFTVASSECVFSPGYGRWFSVRPGDSSQPINNTVMKIRAAGSVFTVGTKSVHTSMTDLPSSVNSEQPNDKQDTENSIKIDNVKMKITMENPSSSLKIGVHQSDTSNDLRVDTQLHTLSLVNRACQNQKMPGSTSMEDSGIDCSPMTEDFLIPPPEGFTGTLSREDSQEDGFLPIRKSKSAPNPFKKARANKRNGQKLSNVVRKPTCGKFH